MEIPRMNGLIVIVLLTIVMVLMMVQIPLDFRTHHLSRSATIGAALVISMSVVIDAWVSRSLATAGVSVLATIAVMGVYGIVHRVSPHSLGWGDVLLVVPLTLAVAYVSVMSVIWWQLAAATTGAVHAVWVRIRSGSSHVPFGPHLLVSAWLMLVTSV